MITVVETTPVAEPKAAGKRRGLFRRQRTSTRETLVIAGNGMVSHKLCENLLAREGAGRFRIVVFGEESRPAYDRDALADAALVRSNFIGRPAGHVESIDLALRRQMELQKRK